MKIKEKLDWVSNVRLSLNKMAKALKDAFKENYSVRGKLRESEEKYRTLFERVKHGIFISSIEGRFIDCNQAMLDMLGYDNKEDFLSLDLAKDLYINPKDRKVFQELIERDGFVKDFEVDFRRRDGEKITILLTAHARRDERGKIIGYEGLNVDITERRSLEKKLTKSEEKYRTLFERVKYGIFISSIEGRIIDCNQAMLDMLGYDNKEDFLSLDLAKELYINPKDRKVFQELIERDGFVKDFEVDFRRKDGEKITILLTAHARRDERGKIIGYEGLDVDITERRSLEKKLKDLNIRYLELLGFATHELKQPMGVLKGYLIMLRDETIGTLTTEKQRQAVNSMLRSTERLIDMSNKYLRLSKIESGELELVKKRFAIFKEVINPLINREMMSASEKRMKITIEDRDAFEKLEIEADSILIEVVYANLVSNAIKYGRKGSEISLGFRKNGKSFIFSVRNEGEGIPPDKLEDIFGKFVRLDKKSPLKGSGLGLYNTREIIERHGGKIWAESEEGKWANFIFTLPQN